MSSGIDPIIRRAIEAAGGTAALAQRLGIQAPSIYSWRRVPANRVLAVESATGLSRHALRPDIYPPEAPASKSKSRGAKRQPEPEGSARPTATNANVSSSAGAEKAA